MTHKISKAQMAILKQMSDGRRINRRTNGILTIGSKTVLLATLCALDSRGLIEATSEWGNTYTITDTGRSLVEQEAAKEVEAQ